MTKLIPFYLIVLKLKFICKITIRTLLFLLLFPDIKSQEIPNEFFQFHFEKTLLDAGKNWENNTIFGSSRFSHGKTLTDSLTIKSRFGSYLSTNGTGLYGFALFSFKSNFHGYLYPRIVDQPELFDRFTGVPRKIKRAGFNSGETDLSGICYQNEWMILQFGRGRQSWGAGNDIQLAISENSPSYDYGMLDLDFGDFKARYFHGYLETDSLSYNRYITGRGFEWKNRKDLVLGLSEIVVYSGFNRPIDFSYFNPMSTHLEIELNDRQGSQGTGSGNGVWQLSADLLTINDIRISMNYLFDEFTLDDEQIKNNKANARAYSLKILHTPLDTKNAILSVYCSIIAVGTHTFRHQVGYNNFVQRNEPLGWALGSDSRELKIGLNTFYKNRLFTNIESGQREIGGGNMKESPYEGYTDYYEVPFPSGVVENKTFFKWTLHWWWKQNISFLGEVEYVNSNFIKDDLEINVGVDIFYPLNTKL